jgi:hypothetical protein
MSPVCQINGENITEFEAGRSTRSVRQNGRVGGVDQFGVCVKSPSLLISLIELIGKMSNLQSDPGAINSRILRVVETCQFKTEGRGRENCAFLTNITGGIVQVLAD